LDATFTSTADTPLSAASYSANGNTVNLSLGFAPPVGSSLTVVRVTGLSFIGGRFDNLAQGQHVNLAYNGIRYPFVANYFGGSGFAYGAECSETLEPGSWKAVPDSGSGTWHEFKVPVGPAPRMFMRLTVTPAQP
jgi:hypothetical protein